LPILPRPQPATDTGRRAWNLGPVRRHDWTILDDLPRTTDLMVVQCAKSPGGVASDRRLYPESSACADRTIRSGTLLLDAAK
jgi:hypothetical protein